MRIVLLLGSAAYAMSADLPPAEHGADPVKRAPTIVRAMPDHMPILQGMGPVERMPILVPPDKPCDHMPIVVPPADGIVRPKSRPHDSDAQLPVER
jgi:hypothetical protein